MKKRYSLILAALLSLAAFCNTNAITRQQLAQYAQTLKGKKKAELKTALYNLMQPSKVLDYGSGTGHTWEGFYHTDRIASTNECRNRYSTDKFYFTGGNKTNDISGMNIEHSFPKSWWGGDKNKAYKDLFNLYPSESSANSSKGNYVMGKVTNPAILDDYEKVGYGSQGKVRMVEPHDNWKGDFCRSYFYMVTTYQNLTWTSEGLNCLENNTYPTLQEWAYTQYLSWCKTDKIDNIEVDRNNAVYNIQDNRNLFIDYPFLAEYVWGDSVDVAFDPAQSITTASDDDRYGNYTPNPDDPNNPDDPTYDGWIFAKITSQPTAGKRYLVVVNDNGSLLAMKTFSKNYDYPKGDAVRETDGKITLNSDADAFTFEASGTGFLLKGSDNKYYYNDKSHKNFNANKAKPSNNVWTVTSRRDGTFIITNGSNFIQYSPNFKSFGAYTSEQSGALYPCLYEELDKTTGIDAIQNHNVKVNGLDNTTFTLQGMRVNSNSKLRSGIYVKNGKKFIVK